MKYPIPASAQDTMSKLLRSGKVESRAISRLGVIYDRAQAKKGRKATALNRGVSVVFVDRWWKRWQSEYERVVEWFSDNSSGRSFTADKNFLLSLVEDAPRSGAPPTFAAGVREKVIALALTKPAEHGLPFERWSHELLAKHVVASGIAPKMSSTRVGDFLKSARH